jgi:hypothetical protein
MRLNAKDRPRRSSRLHSINDDHAICALPRGDKSRSLAAHLAHRDVLKILLSQAPRYDEPHCIVMTVVVPNANDKHARLLATHRRNRCEKHRQSLDPNPFTTG